MRAPEPLLPYALQYASWASDVTWAVGSSAVVLALPILIEIQRESTIMIVQRQREVEQASLAVSDCCGSALDALAQRKSWLGWLFVAAVAVSSYSIEGVAAGGTFTRAMYRARATASSLLPHFVMHPSDITAHITARGPPLFVHRVNKTFPSALPFLVFRTCRSKPRCRRAGSCRKWPALRRWRLELGGRGNSGSGIVGEGFKGGSEGIVCRVLRYYVTLKLRQRSLQVREALSQAECG